MYGRVNPNERGVGGPLIEGRVDSINVFASVEKTKALRELGLHQLLPKPNQRYKSSVGTSYSERDISTNRHHAIDIECEA